MAQRVTGPTRSARTQGYRGAPASFLNFLQDISTSSTASTVDDTSGKWIAASELASLASFAQAGGMMLPPRPSTNVRSPAVKRIPKCAPEHLAAVLPPPFANTSDLGSSMRLFLNHTRTNSQRWPASSSYDLATSTAYLYLVSKSAGNGQAGRSYPWKRCSWPAFDEAALLHRLLGLFEGTLRAAHEC